MADFLMPALGADMETGRIVQWLVAPGATVKSGDVVAVVESERRFARFPMLMSARITFARSITTSSSSGGTRSNPLRNCEMS